MLPHNQIQLKGYLFWGVILGLIGLAMLVVLPFMIAVLSAYLLAYMARPLFLQLSKRMSASLAATVCVLTAIALVVVPVALIIIEIFNQSGQFATQQNITHYLALIASHPLLRGFNLETTALQAQLNTFLSASTSSFLGSTPDLLVGLFIVLLGMYYILFDWEMLSTELKKHIPSTNKERIIRELDKTAKAILYGTLVMAILEFGISYLGFSFLGVEGSLILAAIIFVLAFIPSIGPIMVWGPLLFYYLATQQYPAALGIGVIGVILTVGIETILYAKWIGDRTRIHPFVMILGVIGGIGLFGIFGFIFGPLILAMGLELVKSAMQEE